jgi:hypothetical protein
MMITENNPNNSRHRMSRCVLALPPIPIDLKAQRKLALTYGGLYNTVMTTDMIHSMTLPEQIETMERLWDSICHAGKEPDSPVWHESVVCERQQRYRNGEAETISLNEIKKRFGR